jgi:hypothetical protein
MSIRPGDAMHSKARGWVAGRYLREGACEKATNQPDD